MMKTAKKTISLLLALVLCFSLTVPAVAADTEFWWQQFSENPEEDLRAPGVNENGQVITSGGYVLLTSDPHSAPFLARDLLELANGLVREDGEEDSVGLFALGGDFADNGLLPDVMTVVKHAIADTSPDTAAVYTMGNHETSHSDEEFLAITGMPRIGETAVSSDGLYYFYSFGMRENQGFNLDDIARLAEYLESHNDGKPVFVFSHFPIHYYNSMRSVYGAGAEELMEVLNRYPQVIFTWGHNHSEADPSYATVRFPGETITYGPDLENTVELRFTYLSVGSLRYGVNGENGVLVKVNADGSVNFRFLSLEQKPADDTVFADSTGTTFESLTATNPHVIAEAARPALDENYYSAIRTAQAFIARPKVGRTPAAREDVRVYSDRYSAAEIVWSADGRNMEPGEVFDFDTAYTAAVTLKAGEGYAFALEDTQTSGIDPVYDGPMGDGYNVGVTGITVVDDTTVVLEYTFPNTVRAFDPPVSPATEIEEDHVYVMASNDETSCTVYYRYEYQEGARKQNMKPWVNTDAVIRDGKLASVPDAYETFTAVYDETGYQLWSDASLLDHGYGDQSIETLNILKVMVLARMFMIESEPGEIAFHNNWNIDENGLPYVDMEGLIVYPYTDGVSLSGVTDPAACNIRLYDVGEINPSHYIVVSNVTAPMTGETPDPGTPDRPVVWSPADEVFRPDTVYTAAVEVALDTPVTSEEAAIGRMNGTDVDISFSEDGLTATLSCTFPATNALPTPVAGLTATKAESFEAGKTYLIVAADGTAMTSMTTPNGLYLEGAEVTFSDDGDTIAEGITDEMLFTMIPGDKDGAFYIISSRGYLIARQTKPDIPATWGVAFTDEPGMSVTYADGWLYTEHTGVSGGFNFGPNYFYFHNGYFNFSDFADASAFSIYEVDHFDPAVRGVDPSQLTAAAASGETSGEASTEASGEASAEASGEASAEASDASAEQPAAEMTAAAAERALPLEGVPNAWQLGGYVTEDGRRVRENALLRTGALTDATEEDLRTLSEDYHVTLIVDFRSPVEKTQAPEPEIDGADYVSISLEDTQRQAGSSADMAAMMSIEMQFSDEPGRGEVEAIRAGLRSTNEDLYIEKITSEDIDAGIRAFLDALLAQDEGAVVLYHCKSGKDRTGMATMVLLTLLGVDEETVLEDFDLTNAFLADEINAEVAQAGQYTDEEDVLNTVRIMAGVSRGFMARAFDYAEQQSGSMLEYIRQRYNVTDEEIGLLRELYLTD